MKQAGRGSRAIIIGGRGAGQMGHAFNAVTRRGKVVFLDGQSGGEADVSSSQGFQDFWVTFTQRKAP
jgi:hypothetical protein